jgi:uncharacterized membrane protein YkoI
MDPDDITDKVWCRDVGLVFDTSDGKHIESDGLKNPPKTVGYKPVVQQQAGGPTRKIDDEQAAAIALAAVPGEVMDIAVERKMGGKRIVVEVIASADMVETDAIIDRVTGEVLGTEK